MSETEGKTRTAVYRQASVFFAGPLSPMTIYTIYNDLQTKKIVESLRSLSPPIDLLKEHPHHVWISTFFDVLSFPNFRWLSKHFLFLFCV